MQSLDEKIGQLLIYGWQDDTESCKTVNDHAKGLVDDLGAGGVILFTRNYENPEQLSLLIRQMQEINGAHGRPPLFVAVDQEGGRVSRLQPPHFSQTPTAKSIGNRNDTEYAKQTAALIAKELKAVGINWDFAPVLDVNNNPNNPVIGDRSFGDTPDLVARMGTAQIEGYEKDGGILSCGKHFPGHGDTDVDSHLDLPVIAHNRDRMDRIELVPFKAAIQSGISAIMTAHIMFTAIDKDLPATLSPHILKGILRNELGFKGIIITDCLEMKGVAKKWGSVEAAILAIEAGADILLCCHTLTTQRAIKAGLLDAVKSGRIPESRIDESYQRIMAMKKKWL